MKGRLLIVDDDTSLCNNLRSFFERNKYKVETANDGITAVKMVEKSLLSRARVNLRDLLAPYMEKGQLPDAKLAVQMDE